VDWWGSFWYQHATLKKSAFAAFWDQLPVLVAAQLGDFGDGIFMRAGLYRQAGKSSVIAFSGCLV